MEQKWYITVTLEKKNFNELDPPTFAPSEEWMSGPLSCFYGSYPELEKYKDNIHLVYASTHRDHCLRKRDTSDVLNEIRNARKNGKKKIVFFNGSETFIKEIIFKCQRIAELLEEIPREDLFFSVGSIAGQEFYDDLCLKYKWNNRLNVLSSHHFEYFISQFSKKQAEYTSIEYNIKPKEKLFVCFNKVHRKHRLQLLAEAIRNGWLDKTYYSFEGATPGWYNEKRPLPVTKEDVKAILGIRDRLPLRLNITEDRLNPVDLRDDDIIYHDNSYFSIVTETIMGPYDPKDGLLDYMNTLFLSEKIYKPFAFKHPFIAFAWPGTIAALNERGYKTFHPFIDESYDSEPDFEKRFKMCVEEIKRLEKFTTEEWLEWQKNIKPIVEHNYKYLQNLSEHRDGPPVDHLFI